MNKVLEDEKRNKIFMGFNLMCEKCKPNLLFRSAFLELIGMHLPFHFAKCVLQLPSFIDMEY